MISFERSLIDTDKLRVIRSGVLSGDISTPWTTAVVWLPSGESPETLDLEVRGSRDHVFLGRVSEVKSETPASPVQVLARSMPRARVQHPARAYQRSGLKAVLEAICLEGEVNATVALDGISLPAYRSAEGTVAEKVKEALRAWNVPLLSGAVIEAPVGEWYIGPVDKCPTYLTTPPEAIEVLDGGIVQPSRRGGKLFYKGSVTGRVVTPIDFGLRVGTKVLVEGAPYIIVWMEHDLDTQTTSISLKEMP